MHSATAVRLLVRPSRHLAVFMLAAHLLAIASIVVSNLPTPLSVVFLIGVGASVAWQRKPQSEIELMLRHDGRIERKVGAEETALVELHPLSTRLGPLVVLLFRGQGGQSSLTLLPDSLVDDDAWNDLQRWLRWQAKTA